MIYCEDYSSYECGCPERKEIESLRQQLAGANARIELMGETALNQQKREVMLREALEHHQSQTRPIQKTIEALAATAPKEEWK